MLIAILAGALAGIGIGYVLQRGQLCFHSMFAGAWLAVVYLTPLGEGLNTGLAFRPMANVIGGLLIGLGMAIAQSCVSGLLYKFGAGMAGAAVGIVGWIGGELAVRGVTVPGPTVLPGGDARRSPVCSDCPSCWSPGSFWLSSPGRSGAGADTMESSGSTGSGTGRPWASRSVWS